MLPKRHLCFDCTGVDRQFNIYTALGIHILVSKRKCDATWPPDEDERCTPCACHVYHGECLAHGALPMCPLVTRVFENWATAHYYSSPGQLNARRSLSMLPNRDLCFAFLDVDRHVKIAKQSQLASKQIGRRIDVYRIGAQISCIPRGETFQLWPP
jgi:hypothetical protein